MWKKNGKFFTKKGRFLPHWMVIMAKIKDGCIIRNITKELYITDNAATDIIANLEKDNFIKKVRHDRSCHLYLTEKGHNFQIAISNIMYNM